MQAETEFLILPYASAKGRSLLHILIEELSGTEWTEFLGAVGFFKRSGNFPDLLTAIREFASRDSTIRLSLTLGADVFPGGAKGSDLEAVRELLESTEDLANASVFLYHEVGRTFHPKLYLFSNVDAQQALVIVGSSNWSEGGLVQNVEANVLVRLNLDDPDHKSAFDDLRKHFDTFWSQSDG